ncbi:MAG: putative oxidoreductase [Acidimicrobiia bacterium]|nr:MAG: putative oxidoreductase [Acidimicrobiia bacterium]
MSGLDDASTAAVRTAIVTGASGGIGRAIALAFGGLGWRVALGARREDALRETERLVTDAGGEAFVHALDVCEPASIDAFVVAAAATLGPVDVLVNNAGIARPGALHDMDDGDHRRILETNLVGPLLLSKRVVAALRAGRRPGDVVFVSSDVTVHPRPHLGTYTVSKAGLEALATVLAMECEGHAIRSTIVRVGPTLTSFGDGWDPAVFAELFPYWQRFGIQRHFGVMQPDDVARAVVAAVTAPPHMWVPVVEVQPQPPLT